MKNYAVIGIYINYITYNLPIELLKKNCNASSLYLSKYKEIEEFGRRSRR